MTVLEDFSVSSVFPYVVLFTLALVSLRLVRDLTLFLR